MGRHSNAHERLLTVALQLLQQKSYGAVGVDAICKMAGVNKGSFYHFFPTKSELVVAAMEQAWQEFRDQILEPSFQSQIPPEQRFVHFFDAVYEHSKQQHLTTGHAGGCLFGSLGCELSGQEEPIQQKTAQIMGRIEDYFHRALKDAAPEGANEAEDVSLTAKAILAYWQGMQIMAKVANNPDLFRELSSWPWRYLAASANGRPISAQPQAVVASRPREYSGRLDFID